MFSALTHTFTLSKYAETLPPADVLYSFHSLAHDVYDSPSKTHVYARPLSFLSSDALTFLISLSVRNSKADLPGVEAEAETEAWIWVRGRLMSGSVPELVIIFDPLPVAEKGKSPAEAKTI